MTRISLVLSIALALALGGCQTPYGEMGILGGVSATPITSDTIMISARGNGFTDSSRVQQFVLLKAAEECLAHGFDKFGFISQQDATQHSVSVIPGSTTSYSNVNVYGNTATVTTNSYTTPSTVVPVVKPGADAMVKFMKASDPAAASGLDAREIVANLGPQLKK